MTWMLGSSDEHFILAIIKIFQQTIKNTFETNFVKMSQQKK